MTALCKYVGSKRWLVAARSDLLPRPDPGAGILAPFVGGGSVAAHYGVSGRRVIASDVNAALIRTHRQVASNVELVIEQLEDIVREWRRILTPCDEADRDIVGRTFFEEQRRKLVDPRGDGDDYTLAARFLFVVRAGFNGLWRENASGECNVAYGKPKLSRDLVDAAGLLEYAAAVRGVEFVVEDFAVTCARARPGWAVYLDPPYSATFTDYCGGDWADRPMALPGLGHAGDRDRLAEMLRYLDAIGARWSLSDADTPTTRHLYATWPREMLARKGTVSCDGEGRGDQPEILVTNWRAPKARAA